MKSAYKFLLAAFAATVALASCTKDIAADKQDTGSQDGLRKIAISFGTPTKTVLGDGLTPEFVGGESILVSDESGNREPVQVELYKNGKDAYFRTSLKGSLYAVYPASAAIFEEDGKLSVEKFNILSEQTGLFEDANIAVGHQSMDENQMKFYNASAILKFYVGPEIDVNKLIINAEDTLDVNWKLTGAGSISVNLSPGSKFRKILGNEERVCYVAVPPISSTVKMTVESYTTTQTSSPDMPVTRVFRGNTVEVNQMVNVFIPYYITVKGQKWAYCNIGAFLPEEAGEYFAWGDTMGAKYLPKENLNTPFVGDSGLRFFSWSECPFNDGKDDINYEEFKNAVAGGAVSNGVLALNNDAANIKWGEGWRMPTRQEFEKLMAGEQYSTALLGKYPFTVGSLRLPVTGYALEGDGNTYFEWQDAGVYWTSSLNETDNSKAYCFIFGPWIESNTLCKIDSTFFRKFGFPIRPIYDSQGGSDEPGPDDPVGDEGMKFQELKEMFDNI